MKKGASESNAKRVQREAVRRSQAAGKRLADKQRLPEGVAQDEAAIAIPRRVRYGFVAVLVFIAVAAIVIVGARNAPAWLTVLTAPQSQAQIQTPSATSDVSPPGLANEDSVGDSKRVGIVSGHRGNDSGTICADGLTEAQVNFDHATRIASFLRSEGYLVDILDEFDPRLKGYRARALLSIHADSCTYINDLATGFKVARVLDSRVPEEEDKLVACITSRYKRATGLRFHANTITYDMTQYHAFYEIDQNTPAAIIETGFLYLDRPLLTRRPEVVARGITEGLRCYLEGEEP